MPPGLPIGVRERRVAKARKAREERELLLKACELLKEKVGPLPQELLAWYTNYQEEDKKAREEERLRMQRRVSELQERIQGHERDIVLKRQSIDRINKDIADYEERFQLAEQE